MNARSRACQLVALAAVIALAGCGTAADGTKAGGQAAPVILRIGTDDNPGRPAPDQIEEFARQVHALSDGGVRIEPVWNAAGDSGDDDWDQKVARMVVAGELEAGLIPARAWDTEGVMSLRALNAPLLITSDELAAAVASSELAGTMLAGLDTVGVTGLALWPEGLRHVFSFRDPLLAPGDFTGQLIRVPASDTAYETFKAIGALPEDVTAGEDAVVAGAVAGAESSFARASTLPRPATGVGNLTLYPKYNSLVINTSVWSGLASEQQAVLRDAAQRTLGWAIDHVPDEAAAASEYCQWGGRVVNADHADVMAFREAVQPVYAELEQDPVTLTLIEQIRAVRASTGAEAAPIAPCDPAELPEMPDPGGRASEASPAHFPEGVYRADLTLQGLLAAGVPAADASNIAGLFTLTFAAGQLTVHDVNARTGEEYTDTGTYCVEDGRISLNLDAFAEAGSDDPCASFWSAAWTLADDQLRLVDVRTTEGNYPIPEGPIFGSQPFTRIS